MVNRILYFSILCLLSIYYVNRISLLLMVSFAISMILFSLNYKKIKKFMNILLLFLIISLIFILLKYATYQYVETYYFMTLFYFIFNLGVLSFNIGNPKEAYKVNNLFFLILNVVLLVYFVIGYTPYEISSFNSGNIINFIYILITSLIIAQQYYLKNKINIIPVILCLIISIWTAGKSGIVVSIILLIGILLLKTIQKKNYRSIIILILITTLLIVSLERIYTKINDFLIRNQINITSDEARSTIWGSYIDQQNTLSWLLGLPNRYYYFAIHTNTHNSFLDYHYSFGMLIILPLLFIIIAILNSIFKKNYIFSLILFVILLRGFSDSFILFGRYDFTWLSIVYYAFMKKGVEFEREKSN